MIIDVILNRYDNEKSINHVLNVNNYGASDYSEYRRREKC